jgi:ATP-dependent helicase/nuclease subunit B
VAELSDLPAQHDFTIVCSPAAAVRIEAARRFLFSHISAPECLLLGETRESIDDFARDVSCRAGAVFGLHRFSLRQLAARLASAELARQGLVPATGLNVEAVASRAAFEELAAKTLKHLAPIAGLRSVARTLARTLEDLRHANINISHLAGRGEVGDDLVALAGQYQEQLAQAMLVDSAGLLRTAAAAARGDDVGSLLDGPLILLDVAVHDDATHALVGELVARSPHVLATIPEGDRTTRTALERLPGAHCEPPDQIVGLTSLERVRQYLFMAADLPAAPYSQPSDSQEVSFFSAPGEGRECVEIARRILREAARGVPLDCMAILVRSPHMYAGLIETALNRASVPAWFVRGTQMPDPAGRAFLALLACAAERLSARRFSEYLSLAQVPLLPLGDEMESSVGNQKAWIPPANADEVLPGPAVPAQATLSDFSQARRDEPSDSDDQPVVAGSLRAPWQWDRLLVESAVIGGLDRWTRRLDGLSKELELRREEWSRDEPESARIRGIERDIRNLSHLRRFAVPVIERLAALPESALWGDWLDVLEELAPLVLKDPNRVLALLGELRPMSPIGPVRLGEVRDVLSERLTELQDDPPSRRYGRVFVGRPEHARGRLFDVVFVPGLAERMFPQKQRQDPLLLDDLRRILNQATRAKILGLSLQDDRANRERLLLQLAVGAAGERLYLSYPRLQAAESRPRVPSFYALDIERARGGHVPDFRALEQAAYERAGARLAWPAPVDPDTAIDDAEHDLAVLEPLLHADVPGAFEVKGRARYLLKLNSGLRRSLLTRWARWKPTWSRYDGLHGLTAQSMRFLSAYRLTERPYSVSALQRFAVCPYKFLLSTIYRLEPRKKIQPLERLDALTRGRMFHEVQAEVIRALRRHEAVPVTQVRLAEAEDLLDTTLDAVAATYYENLAPAIDRVWTDEVETMRTDLKGWLHHVADEGGEWIPIRAEFGFGFPGGNGRDPESVPEPVIIGGKWTLHGIVDLVEAKAGPTSEGELRVTDHKTGRNRTRERLIVGQGEVLQPVLYGLAVEEALGRPVVSSGLFFCTVDGEFSTCSVRLGEMERQTGLEVVEIIDRSIERGSLLPAPRKGACAWCDFKEICGPWEETRVTQKDQTKLADLYALRQLP